MLEMIFSKKKDRKAFINIMLSVAIILFAYFFWIYLKSDSQLRVMIFDPLLNENIWISAIVFVLWFLLLFWFYKSKSDNKKWKYNRIGFSRKVTITVAFSVLTFMFVFALVDAIASNSSLNKAIKMVMQLDLLSALVVFGFAFAVILYLTKANK